MTSTFRFAPSPNGRLHLGHALSAITGFEMAGARGGRFLVRIEDIDTNRSQPEFVAAIFEDLAWLGLDWEKPVLRQSEHFDVYRQAAGRLAGMGLLYPCFATRNEIAAAVGADHPVDPDGAPIYTGLHRSLRPEEVARRRDRGDPFALRIDMARAVKLASAQGDLTFLAFDEAGRDVVVDAHPERWGDAVIVRKDVPASYHLACVVDDARQGVTHVTRGLDLLAATDVHVLLQRLLGLPQPRYHHHRLLTDPTGRKLAKSAGDISLSALRASGCSPQDVRRMMGLAS